MKFPSLTARIIAIIMLMFQLLLPAMVHAHRLALFKAEKLPGSDFVWINADMDSNHDESDGHTHSSTFCQPDTPLDIMHLQLFVVAPVVDTLTSFVTGRLLPGYFRPIYIPPRQSA